MQLLSAQQIRQWDEYTIRNEPVSSLDLMERAARKCFEWLLNHEYESRKIHVFCGKGNNGGDGLAIARLLHQRGIRVDVHILEFGHLGTDDFQANLVRLHNIHANIRFIPAANLIPELYPGEIIIDALLGSGLNRPVDGLTKQLINTLNDSGIEIISIDMPSGLPADSSSLNHTAIRATHTLTFQCLKKSFLLSENEEYLGDIHELDIGLKESFLDEIKTTEHILLKKSVRKIIKKRPAFSHKGSFGHALLIVGSYGKAGAAVLAGKACLRSGAGLTTIHAPSCSYSILQTTIPEAMVMVDKNQHIITEVHVSDHKFTVAGIGPGIGTDPLTMEMLSSFLETFRGNLVMDADALNILSADRELFKKLPPGTILTPHPKEFERLFGKTSDSFERLNLASSKSKELNIIIVLKGKHTSISLPSGETWFNTTGNPGMATGGTGDVLTGIITGLLAQKYSPEEAAKLGVYIHGLAGDLAVADSSQEAMIAGDLVDYLGKAFRESFNQLSINTPYR